MDHEILIQKLLLFSIGYSKFIFCDIFPTGIIVNIYSRLSKNICLEAIMFQMRPLSWARGCSCFLGSCLHLDEYTAEQIT